MELGIQTQSPHLQPLCSTEGPQDKCCLRRSRERRWRDKNRSLNKGAWEMVVLKRWVGKELQRRLRRKRKVIERKEGKEGVEKSIEGHRRKRKVRKESCHGSQGNGILVKEGKVDVQYCREVKQDKHRHMSIEVDNLLAIGIGDLSRSQIEAGWRETGKRAGRTRKSWWPHVELGLKGRKERRVERSVRWESLLFFRMKVKRLVTVYMLTE